MTIPVAHAGHWAAQLAYVAPALVLVLLVVWDRWRAGRSRESRESPDVEEPGDV